MLGGGPISWKSQKQQLVMLFIIEAEFVGESHCGTMIEWLRGLLQELQIEGIIPDRLTPIYADNQAVIGMAERLKFSKKTKHITIRYYYVRELVDRDIIQMEYVSTTEMIADALIKPVGRVKFDAFIKGMGMAWATEVFGPKERLDHEEKDKI